MYIAIHAYSTYIVWTTFILQCLRWCHSNEASTAYSTKLFLPKILFVKLQHSYGTAQFKLYTCVQVYTRVLAHLTHAKLQKLACARTVACHFGVRTWDSKHMRHMRGARHELALGLPHYMCGVTTGTVAVGNEIQLLCSWLASLYIVMSITW